MQRGVGESAEQQVRRFLPRGVEIIHQGSQTYAIRHRKDGRGCSTLIVCNLPFRIGGNPHLFQKCGAWQ